MAKPFKKQGASVAGGLSVFKLNTGPGEKSPISDLRKSAPRVSKKKSLVLENNIAMNAIMLKMEDMEAKIANYEKIVKKLKKENSSLRVKKTRLEVENLKKDQVTDFLDFFRLLRTRIRRLKSSRST
jgi:hypothetical protein